MSACDGRIKHPNDVELICCLKPGHSGSHEAHGFNKTLKIVFARWDHPKHPSFVSCGCVDMAVDSHTGYHCTLRHGHEGEHKAIYEDKPTRRWIQWPDGLPEEFQTMSRRFPDSAYRGPVKPKAPSAAALMIRGKT